MTCSKSSMHGLLGYGFSCAKSHRFPMDQWEEVKQRGKTPENDLSAFVTQKISPHMNIFSVDYLFSFNTVTAPVCFYMYLESVGPLQGQESEVSKYLKNCSENWKGFCFLAFVMCCSCPPTFLFPSLARRRISSPRSLSWKHVIQWHSYILFTSNQKVGSKPLQRWDLSN